ncbi:MAG: hypothetical protein NDF54_04270 [archaeon GB-1867-035]|nr:hypothetical protein [Candidatus Culexmicrobium profundum]
MMGRRRKVNVAERIIKACEYVIRRGSNPFEVDVPELLSSLDEYLRNFSSISDLVLDLNAIEKISQIVELQGDWVKSRSSKLYFDPMIIEWKIKSLSLKKLASILIHSWYPIASLKILSPSALEAAIKYWVELPPLKGRWGYLPPPVYGMELTSIEDLIKNKLALEGSFNDMIEEFWRRVLRFSKGRPIPYWDFVKDDSYETSLLKAFMISFLASYGYVTLEFDPKIRDYLIIPMDRPRRIEGGSSIAISFSYDDWIKRVGGDE